MYCAKGGGQNYQNSRQESRSFRKELKLGPGDESWLEETLLSLCGCSTTSWWTLRLIALLRSSDLVMTVKFV